MNEQNMQSQYIEEDKIDLRELWRILMKRKMMIGVVTALITLLAVVYALLVKPIYEVKAVMELAQIEKKPVQNLTDLKQKLEVIFEVNAKGKKIELPVLSGVSLPKKTSNILVLHAQGYDNATAQQKLQEIIDYVMAAQDKELASYTDIQKEKLSLIKQDIDRNVQLIIEIEGRMQDYENKLLTISKQDAALAGLYAIEIGKKQTELNDATNKIYSLRNKKNDLELSVSPLKIQKAVVIGKVEVMDYPIKPKKKLIVVVAFVTGLMLSVFLAFFLEFISSGKREE
ncbi:MAG: Wzz/FepE/Etk N-terminal domain-containing protein [Campylobacterota bacterium]|nr:Wzz/FepE/Etk N-terminal domain-containing protein [Campylobacterota bacterium]